MEPIRRPGEIFLRRESSLCLTHCARSHLQALSIFRMIPRSPLHSGCEQRFTSWIGPAGGSLTWVDVLASPPLSDVREPYTMCLWSYRRKSLRLSRHWSASFSSCWFSSDIRIKGSRLFTSSRLCTQASDRNVSSCIATTERADAPSQERDSRRLSTARKPARTENCSIFRNASCSDFVKKSVPICADRRVH
jgi:hypothetical protein